MSERRYAPACFNDVDYYTRRSEAERQIQRGTYEDPVEAMCRIVTENDPELEGAITPRFVEEAFARMSNAARRSFLGVLHARIEQLTGENKK